MKKLLLSLLLILSLLLTACQTGGEGAAEGTTDKNPIEEETTTSEKSDINYIRYQPVIKFYRLDSAVFDHEESSYLSSQAVISYRTPDAREFIEKLSLLQSTGKTVPAIPSEAFDHSLTGPYGTIWIETEDALYRVEPSPLRICRVETYLGEGIELALTEEVETLIEEIWSENRKFDLIYGRLEGNEFEVSEETEQETPMDIRITHIERQHGDWYLFLEVSAKKDLHISVSWEASQGSDALCGGGRDELDIQKGEKQIVKMRCEPGPQYIDLKVSAENAICHMIFAITW